MQFGKSKARRLTGDEPKVTFADVAGCDEAVEELSEIRDFLADPDRFRAIGAKIPKGVLLYGPPGTGKTLLARAVAGEAGVPFFTISGSDFVEMFVGVGASRVRDLFEQAKPAAPAIIFVDEIDAVGRHRGSGMGGGHDEREQTLNQLLVEMDGFDASDRRDPHRRHEPARHPRPGAAAARAASTARSSSTVPTSSVAGRSSRCTPRASRSAPGSPSTCWPAARRASPAPTSPTCSTRRRCSPPAADLTEIGMHECEDAIDRVIAGPERTTRVLERAREVGDRLPRGRPRPRRPRAARAPTRSTRCRSSPGGGRWAGRWRCRPRTACCAARSELRDELAMLLGGRTAEELVFGDPTTGAQNDIERATQIARAMVTEWGMSESLGPRQLGAGAGEAPPVHPGAAPTSDHGDELASQIDDEVRALIDDAHAEAREILVTHRATLDRLAAALVERETLEAEELGEVFEGVGHVTNRPSTSPRPRLVEPVVASVDEPVRVPAGASAAVRGAGARPIAPPPPRRLARTGGPDDMTDDTNGLDNTGSVDGESPIDIARIEKAVAEILRRHRRGPRSRRAASTHRHASPGCTPRSSAASTRTRPST